MDEMFCLNNDIYKSWSIFSIVAEDSCRPLDAKGFVEKARDRLDRDRMGRPVHRRMGRGD